MAIEAGLAAKVIAGVGAAGLGTTALYFGGDYISNSLSKYEKALINLLESPEDYDFIFEVKKDTANDFSASDLTFDSNNKKVSVTAKVQAGSNSIFKKVGGTTVNISELPKINALNNGNWTWECLLTFDKGDATENEIKDEFKKSILEGTDKGLFGILKKDLSNYSDKGTDTWTKKELKKVKIDFIKQCGYSRGVTENKKINKSETTTDLKITVPAFKFIKGSENKLVPESTNTFNDWFKQKYGTKNYATAS